MKTKFHAMMGIIALLTVLTFWVSTIYSEFLGSHALIAQVKTSILWDMLVLIPAMSITGASGFLLAKNRKIPAVARKLRRMKMIAFNGLAILLPSAFFLAMRAQHANFDSWFYGVQMLELTVGAINITLLSLNFKDGIAITKHKRQRH